MNIIVVPWLAAAVSNDCAAWRDKKEVSSLWSMMEHEKLTRVLLPMVGQVMIQMWFVFFFFSVIVSFGYFVLDRGMEVRRTVVATVGS